MNWIALLTPWLSAAAWFVQEPSLASGSVAMAKPPALPLIVQPVLPGEGWAPGTYRLRDAVTVFDTWKAERHLVAKLAAGMPVTLVSGLNQIMKPDLIIVTSPVVELGLHPGDTLLRYTERGEGNADVWAKGRWYTDADLGWVKNADGSGCQSACKAQEREHGQKAWWFQVRLADGRLGWSNAANSLNPN